ncbi:MAG: isoprenylcysteine carboxylmethyltransferase family protein [Candidatus Heimdallarchaeota archaeon]|nr:isoprenylcysteine carboxylmethyltransferase family protein [Candidatus Heimdallarchaeota archaeon]
MIEILNVISLVISFILFSYFYTLSIQPMRLKEKIGEIAWKKCRNYRLFASLWMMTATISIFLWLLYPIDSMNWAISTTYAHYIIGGVILLIGSTIMLLGAIAAGGESITPSADTQMYGGIYKHIRHPQALGEFPMFIAFAFFTNSWFLVIITSIFVLIYTPIMIRYEERDLILRFGASYEEYQKITGALFPRF